MDKQLIDKAKTIQAEIDNLAREILVNREISVLKAYDQAENFIRIRQSKQNQVLDNLLGTNINEEL